MGFFGNNGSRGNRGRMRRRATQIRQRPARRRPAGGRRTGRSRNNPGGGHTHFIDSGIVTNHTHRGHVSDWEGTGVQFAGEVYESADTLDGTWQTDGWEIGRGDHRHGGSPRRPRPLPRNSRNRRMRRR